MGSALSFSAVAKSVRVIGQSGVSLEGMVACEGRSAAAIEGMMENAASLRELKLLQTRRQCFKMPTVGRFDNYIHDA